MSFPHGQEVSVNRQLGLGKVMLDFAMELPKRFIYWDRELLPNPEIYTKDLAISIGKASTLFFYAFVYIVHHEFAHVVLDHDASIEDLDYKQNIEYEADQFAIERVLAGTDGGSMQDAAVRGIIYAICSLSFCSVKFRAGSHPDIDLRLKAALEVMNFDSNHICWSTSSWAILQWYSRSPDVKFDFPEFNNFKDHFYRYLEKVELIKKNGI